MASAQDGQPGGRARGTQGGTGGRGGDSRFGTAGEGGHGGDAAGAVPVIIQDAPALISYLERQTHLLMIVAGTLVVTTVGLLIAIAIVAF